MDSYLKFCEDCNYSLKLSDNMYICVLCEKTTLLDNNSIVYRISNNENNINKSMLSTGINEENMIDKYDLYKKTKKKKCPKCENSVALMYTDNSMNSYLICTKCNARY